MGSPHNAAHETSPEIDGTPIVGVYRGWSHPARGAGGEGALRVVNGPVAASSSGEEGEGRQSVVSEVSELESPARLAAGFRAQQQQQQPTIVEQPFELAGEGGGEGDAVICDWCLVLGA